MRPGASRGALAPLVAATMLALAGPACAGGVYRCAYAGGDYGSPHAALGLAAGEITLDPASLRSPDHAKWRLSGDMASVLLSDQAVARWSGPNLEIRAPLAPGQAEVAFHFNTRTHAGSFEETLLALNPTVRAYFDADCKKTDRI